MGEAQELLIPPDFNFWTFIQNVEWGDPWLVGLITFHIIVTLTAVLTRNHNNFQVILFLLLLLLVYFSENLNEMAATNWRIFSRQQYFDGKGMFVSLVFSVPILLNCMVMVATWLYQSSQLMIQLKKAQLREKSRQLQSNKATKDSEEMHGSSRSSKQKAQ
ncbi:unnamed protein product [Bemisia tabaci]|uniref:Transmembrane protein 18 n=1 Tax=Bemisia tabaci TaxID=7038 RepID=A0A9P0AGU6_BEMTA|nr:PREDICTED: transmembrane protein 18 [Bemisia tabaci]CAH0390439.1 unnamed protein product [Bemisia tabaci]